MKYFTAKLYIYYSTAGGVYEMKWNIPEEMAWSINGYQWEKTNYESEEKIWNTEEKESSQWKYTNHRLKIFNLWKWLSAIDWKWKWSLWLYLKVTAGYDIIREISI